MDEGEARQLLGVSPDAGPAEIRSAFRRRIRAGHPDVVGSAGTAAAARVLDAYRLLRARPSGSARRPDRAEPAAPPPPPRAAGLVRVDGSVVVLASPARLAFAAVLEAGHGLGEVAYVDRSAGLVEVIVEFIDWPVCSVVLGVEPRAPHRTEVTVAVAALSGAAAPPEEGVAALVADRIRDLDHPARGRT